MGQRNEPFVPMAFMDRQDFIMGYFYLILQALIFSFGGLMIKAAGTMVTTYLLSAFRFLIGVALLLLIQKIRTGRVRLVLTDKILIIGGLSKALHYLTENYGVMKGFSYGGILVWPVQTIVVLLISVFIYHEKFSPRTIAGTIMCISGIGIVSWNGASPDVFLNSQATTLLAFVLAGIGAAGFSLAQKKRVNEMDAVELNSSIFTFGLIANTFVLIPTGPHTTGAVNFPGVLSIVLLGSITCFGFLLQAAAVKTVPLLIATVIQSSTVILSIVWGVLFYGDAISLYVILGSALFMAGILAINIKPRAKNAKQAH